MCVCFAQLLLLSISQSSILCLGFGRAKEKKESEGLTKGADIIFFIIAVCVVYVHGYTTHVPATTRSTERSV